MKEIRERGQIKLLVRNRKIDNTTLYTELEELLINLGITDFDIKCF